MSISYELDGKKIEPAELAGKSGHVKIHFDYKNNTSVSITVNDKEKTVKVPFTAVTGLIQGGTGGSRSGEPEDRCGCNGGNIVL